jgi:hypothetical protein
MKKIIRIHKHMVGKTAENPDGILVAFRAAGYEVREEPQFFVATVDIEKQTALVAEQIKDALGRILIYDDVESAQTAITEIQEAAATLELLWAEC